MRVAVVSDIHDNLAAFEAVLADLREASPDLVFHGGDLAGSGSSPGEIVDRIRELGWQGVAGNTDEMLFRPEALTEFASESPAFNDLFAYVEQMAEWTRRALGEERLAWLRNLPRIQHYESITLVHASPGNLWRAPGAQASDAELLAVYGPLDKRVVIYGHIHTPYVRKVARLDGSIFTIANSGSVGLPYDGDTRACYLLIDGEAVTIRRVEYDVEQEVKSLMTSGLPHADWIAKQLRTARPQLPCL
ncbi:MAG TPA: metallophosphoesterase family protein [Terriglobales bacterium]|nr:metallophosphoesterase family protein [Terriglobales bacterium]